MNREVRCTLGVLLLCAPLAAGAQSAPTGALAGRVVAGSTLRPVAGAIISLDASTRQAETNVLGLFRLDSVVPGIYTVRIRAIGFAPVARTDVVVSSGRPGELLVTLQERPVELAELEVTALSYFPPAADQSASTQQLGAEEVRRAPGVQEDVVRAVALLPGVGVTTTSRNDLVVRGGAPFENLFVVDHLEVPNVNHFGSQGSTGGPVSLVNIALVDQVQFAAGGFPARWGNRVGSSTEIDLREGNRQRMAGELNLSATGFGAILEGPLGKQGSVIASVRRSYLDLLFDLAGFNFLPRYYDATVKVTRQLGARDRLSWTSVGALDRVDFNNQTPSDRVDNSRILRLNQNQYFSSLTWQHAAARGRLDVTLGRVYSRFDAFQNDSLNPPTPVFRNRSAEGETSLRADWRQGGARLNWSAGGMARYADRLSYDVDLPGFLRLDQAGNPAPLRVDTTLTAWRTAGWGDLTVRWSSALQTTLGLRGDYYDDLNAAWRAAPRFSASLQQGGTTFRGSVGRYWQSPSQVWVVGDSGNRARLRPFRADQIVLGLSRAVGPDLKLQLEVYHKWYGDYPARIFRPQAVLAPTGFEDVKSDIPFGLEPLDSRGRGRAYGIELLVQKKLSAVPVFGLASVSVARSEFTGLDGQARPGAFDGRFIGTFLLGWRPNAAWELSGKFRLASGLPTTPFITTGATAGQLDFTRYNAGARLPVFHALDLRGDRRWSWRGVQLVTYIDLQNIYARKNVSQLVWNERKQRVETDDALGILPSIGVNLEF